MPSPSATELLAAVVRRDAGAWELLVERYAGLVWSVARAQSLDPTAAADVSQTVWLRLAESCERIRDPERLGAWLATTARNEAIRLSKSARREQPVDLVREESDPLAPAPGERLETGERLAEVRRAFARLDEACQELLRLLTQEPKLDYQAVAELTGRPIGSIGPTRGRCLDRLRRHLTAPEHVGR
ncbi:MAG TPA: sigma-70 family RNA polymerase sigma factor [Acidimicrobiales bacterium]|nr:sigma-70 family RNA polymerase sigma factor [Acidimicrobiales bacterium]